jgi:hypothetical protein
VLIVSLVRRLEFLPGAVFFFSCVESSPCTVVLSASLLVRRYHTISGIGLPFFRSEVTGSILF